MRGALARFDPPPGAVDELIEGLRRRYGEPHRHHHTLRHLDEVLDAVGRLADLADEPDRVRLAAAYHDAIYDPRSPSNEHDSAELARVELGAVAVPADEAEAIARLVRTTADHEAAADPDAAVLADADLWILGSPPDRYRRYVRDVRAEYAHVDDDAWRAGRAAVLDRFLGRPRLYATARFHAALDGRARANLTAERATLG